MAVAKARHAAHEPWTGRFGEWPACYSPPRNIVSTDVNPFTGQATTEPKVTGRTHAWFLVGCRSFWHAEVLFRDGEPDYLESESHSIDAKYPVDFLSPDEVPPTPTFVEGATCRVIVNAYERNPEARRRCIEAHGTRCCICGFSFGAVYGPRAEGYIHVHHVKPLSEVGGEYVVDPINDLRPVCPNCHAVLHFRGRCRTIEAVRSLLRH